MKEYYMVCTDDKYQLPILIEPSVERIAELTGLKLTSLYPIYSKIRRGKKRPWKYDIVRLEDDGI